MGGTDVGLSASVSSSATSGLKQDFTNFFGAGNSSGAARPNFWTLPLILGIGAVVAIVFLFRR